MKKWIIVGFCLFSLCGCATSKSVNHCPVAKIEVYQKSPGKNFTSNKGERRRPHENAISTI